jgi:nicotinate-nucleotide pyrophosphorylase (carboxylating)
MTTQIAQSEATEQDFAISEGQLQSEISRLVTVALAEDVGRGDATSRAIVPPTATCSATIVSRATGVVAGLEIAEAVFATLPGSLTITPLVRDGERVQADTRLVSLEGTAATILTGERTALNFLGHLSGIATLTHAYVCSTRGTNATILDTRKTTPGLRHVEKYAVRCGGAVNHRLGLDDALMIKDNHLLLSGTLTEAVAQARERTQLEITVEVEDMIELAEALGSQADRILLDNMSVPMMREAVLVVNGRVPLEASGGVNLNTVAEIARTGVDFISVGSLTHSAPALDVSLEVTI